MFFPHFYSEIHKFPWMDKFEGKKKSFKKEENLGERENGFFVICFGWSICPPCYDTLVCRLHLRCAFLFFFTLRITRERIESVSCNSRERKWLRILSEVYAEIEKNQMLLQWGKVSKICSSSRTMAVRIEVLLDSSVPDGRWYSLQFQTSSVSNVFSFSSSV